MTCHPPAGCSHARGPRTNLTGSGRTAAERDTAVDGAPTTPTNVAPGRAGSNNRRTAPHHDVGRVLAIGEAYARPAHHKKGTKPRRTGEKAAALGG